MAKGDKKKAFMEKTGKSEQDYYTHSKKVCGKRHFNIRVSQLLAASGFNPIQFLNTKALEFDPAEQQEERDYLLYLVQECDNPVKLLRAYVDNYFNGDHRNSREYHISALLRSFPMASFRRFGDINQVSEKTFTRLYCDEEGMPIDVQAMEMTEIAGIEIEPQDIADFALNYPKGPHSYKPVSLAEKLAERYFSLTGNRLTFSFARQLTKMMDGNENLNLTDNCPF